MLNTPIAFIIFNRPRHTKKTFDIIRSQKPKKLFIIADGPRNNINADFELCQEVKKIVSNIDWDCDVYRNFSEVNLGCKLRPKSGIDWVFDHVDRAIILEDDCLAHEDFFYFCENLLEKYKDNNLVAAITGNNFQKNKKRGDASYYFSKYNHVWGWATWKRSWKNNDSNINFWPSFKKTDRWQKIFDNTMERKYWESIFDKVYNKEFETAWDYPWTASVWFHNGLTATPNVNLVSNIGFGPDGTHTIAKTDQEGLPTNQLGRLYHPILIQQNIEADRFVFDNQFGGNNNKLKVKFIKFPKYLLNKFKHIVKLIIY